MKEEKAGFSFLSSGSSLFCFLFSYEINQTGFILKTTLGFRFLLKSISNVSRTGISQIPKLNQNEHSTHSVELEAMLKWMEKLWTNRTNMYKNLATIQRWRETRTNDNWINKLCGQNVEKKRTTNDTFYLLSGIVINPYNAGLHQTISVLHSITHCFLLFLYSLLFVSFSRYIVHFIQFLVTTTLNQFIRFARRKTGKRKFDQLEGGVLRS